MFHIRLYRPTDRSAVRQLAGDTAFFGAPIEHFFDAREVFLDAFANFYLDQQSDHLWIAEEDGTVLGYLMGCPDTRAYDEWFEANLSRVVWRVLTLRYRGLLTRKSIGYIWRYFNTRVPYLDLTAYPAHLHINTRADRRGAGVGTALMNTYFDQLRQEDVPGVHLQTSSENKIAVPWYEKLGFQLLQRTSTDLYKASVGSTIELLVYGLLL